MNKRMRARAWSWIAALALGCSAPSPPPGACLLSNDCAPDEVCVSGRCVVPDNGGPRDATPGPSAGDAAPVVLDASPRDADAAQASFDALPGGADALPSAPDASTPAHDAGLFVPDAGRVVPDGGVPAADASASDAGRADGGRRIDLSGWVLSNSEAPATQLVTLPQGTVVEAGQVLLIVRAAVRAELEADLGAALPSSVVVISSDARTRGAPIINGGEQWTLSDASGAIVDGPTILGSEGRSYHRLGADPGASSSWSDLADTSRTPGITEATLGSSPWISEWSDALGTGRFVFEYVEIAVP